MEGYTSSLQHLQMSAGHWELHLLPLRLAGRKERRSDEGEEREIKDTTSMVTFFELGRLEFCFQICIFIVLVVSGEVVVGMSEVFVCVETGGALLF